MQESGTGSDSRAQCAEDQGSETHSAPEMKTSFAADNICFILKVAKESSSWANIVPVQYFIVSLFAQG